MIGFYNYTVVLTYIGFISGIIGISNAIEGNTFISVICLMISGLCDMFDGKIARTKKRTKQEKNFGIQIDSLSDVVCFGVLPALIGYAVGIRNTYLVPIVYLFPLAALIRLAYYNVTEEEIKGARTEYLGLPVTSSALIFPVVYCLKNYVSKYFSYIYAFSMLVTGILFITKFKVRKPENKGLFMLLGLGIIIFILNLIFGG